VQGLINIFGIWSSIPEMAADIGEKPDTVARWNNRKRIPERAWRTIIERAAARGETITADDLLDLNEPPKKNGRGSNQAGESQA